MSSIGVVAASAGGVETLREGLVQPLVDDGHQVAVTLTPTAATWLDAIGERARLEALTGLPVRSTPRLPGEPKPHPKSDVLVGAPLSANSVAKLALGIADNQALTVLCECVASVPTTRLMTPACAPGCNRLDAEGRRLAQGTRGVWAPRG